MVKSGGQMSYIYIPRVRRPSLAATRIDLFPTRITCDGGIRGVRSCQHGSLIAPGTCRRTVAASLLPAYHDATTGRLRPPVSRHGTVTETEMRGGGLLVMTETDRRPSNRHVPATSDGDVWNSKLRFLAGSDKH